jgi:hypothetical protein
MLAVLSRGDLCLNTELGGGDLAREVGCFQLNAWPHVGEWRSTGAMERGSWFAEGIER